MTAPESIRAAVSAALAANETRCLDEEGDFREVLDEVTRSVVAALHGDAECDHEMADTHALSDFQHPHANKAWFREQCVECGAQRIVEEEHIPADDAHTEDTERVIAATPWRAG